MMLKITCIYVIDKDFDACFVLQTRWSIIPKIFGFPNIKKQRGITKHPNVVRTMKEAHTSNLLGGRKKDRHIQARLVSDFIT